jgi:hypothetical protein
VREARREGLADEAPLHAFEPVCAASEAHVLAGAVTGSVAQDPFGGLTGWRSRRPRLPQTTKMTTRTSRPVDHNRSRPAMAICLQ